MIRVKTVLALAVLAQGVASAALAADVVIPPAKIADPVVTTFPGRSVDVLGVVPGMTKDAVKAALAEKLPGGKDDVKIVTMGLEYKGARVRLGEFEAELTVSNDSDIVQVFFGSPVTGAAAYGIIRNVTYRDAFKAPTVAATVDALTAKYGKPSARRDNEKLLVLEWMLTGKDDFTCPIMGSRKLPLCPTNATPASDDLVKAQQGMKAGIKAAISANVFHQADAEKVSSMTIVVDDFAKRIQAMEAIDTFLKAAVDKGMSGTAPVKPAL